MPFFILGGLAAAGSIGGALISSNAAQSAANTQAAAANNASNLQWQEFQQTQGLLSPYVNAGTGALTSLQGALGLNPGGTGAPNATALQATPGYQFMLGQGTQAVQNAASSTGGVNSGNTLKALQSYGEGLGNQTFQQYLSNLMGLTTTGQNAAAGVGTAGMNTASQIGANTIGAGNAQAAGTVGAANALNTGIGGVSQNALLAMLLSGGGTGSGGTLGAANSGGGIYGLYNNPLPANYTGNY